LTAGAGLAGCGSSPPSITADASRQLDLQVQAVRMAVAAGNRAAAEGALAQVRKSVAELRSRDKISADRAAKVLDAAAAVEAKLGSMPTTTTTTTTTPPTTRDENKDRRKGGNGGVRD
jgi:hypothetical protein